MNEPKQTMSLKERQCVRRRSHGYFYWSSFWDIVLLYNPHWLRTHNSSHLRIWSAEIIGVYQQTAGVPLHKMKRLLSLGPHALWSVLCSYQYLPLWMRVEGQNKEKSLWLLTTAWDHLPWCCARSPRPGVWQRIKILNTAQEERSVWTKKSSSLNLHAVLGSKEDGQDGFQLYVF